MGALLQRVRGLSWSTQHGPILPGRRGHGRVGKGGGQPQGGLSLGFGRCGLHGASVPRVAESRVTGMCPGGQRGVALRAGSPVRVTRGCGCAATRLWLRRDWGCRLLPVPVTDWPQSPAGLLVAGLRLDRAGHRLASNAGRAVGFAVPPVRGWGGAAPGYLLTNCMVRGQLEYGGRVCSLLRGHPDTSPPHGLVRGRPPEGG
ncbi:hypothetical protein SFR_3918 [Streptomyces sp. FR-008]|nr:hypothetical protein SFR_3918 [Streptomyces sp. FR-008]